MVAHVRPRVECKLAGAVANPIVLPRNINHRLVRSRLQILSSLVAWLDHA